MLKRCLWSLLASALLPSVAWAGAWTLPEGTGQWLTTMTASSGDTYFTGNGVGPTPRYSKEELDTLMEYGITDRVTGVLISGLQNVDIASPTSASRFGLNYTEFGARYGFYQTPDWVASAQATLRLPGTSDISNPAAIGYTDVEGDFRLLAGHNFKIGGMPGFFDLEVAQRQRSDGYPSEFHFDATAGFKIFPRWMLLVQSFNVVSEGSGISYFGGSYEYYKFELSALYSLTPVWSLQFGGFSTYAGRNALQENGVILGVWRTF